jgi:hypothetical protein
MWMSRAPSAPHCSPAPVLAGETPRRPRTCRTSVACAEGLPGGPRWLNAHVRAGVARVASMTPKPCSLARSAAALKCARFRAHPKMRACPRSKTMPSLRTSSELGATLAQLPPHSCIRAEQQSRRGYRVPCDSTLPSPGRGRIIVLLLSSRERARRWPTTRQPLWTRSRRARRDCCCPTKAAVCADPLENELAAPLGRNRALRGPPHQATPPLSQTREFQQSTTAAAHCCLGRDGGGPANASPAAPLVRRSRAPVDRVLPRTCV